MKTDYKSYKSKIQRLESFYGSWKAKALRNLRLYCYSPTVSLKNLTDEAVVGYYQQGYFDSEDDTTSSIQENVINSAISTLTSMIAEKKVRPFFNTIGGTFKDMKYAKAAQEYFDSLYDELNVNKIVSDVFKDGCIFDTGCIYIDNKTDTIERVMPWQVFIDPRESSYGKIRQVVYKREQYPVSLLPFATKTTAETVTWYSYWNCNDHIRFDWYPEINKEIVSTYEPEKIPFLFFHYENPIKGSSSQSVVDLLYGIQMNIDQIMTKVKDATELGRPLHFIMPENSSARVKKLSNRVGEVITYSPIPGQSTPPVATVTDPVMDPSWMNWVEMLKKDAYEIVGVSEMSATSQHQQGLNSGIAIATMENIESSRFTTQLNAVVRLYVEIAKRCIEIFDPDENILPKTKTRANIKWQDIIESKDQLKIQFSAAESLSKDPSVKLQQLQALSAAGLIPQSRVAQLMELPDLQTGYSFSNNAIDAVMTVIDECIEHDNFDVPDYVPVDMLKQEIVSTMLSLKAAANPENEIDIAKLTELYAAVDAKQQEDQLAAQTDEAAIQTEQMEALAQQISSGQADEATMMQAQALLGMGGQQ